jgi:hypothetical protein
MPVEVTEHYTVITGNAIRIYQLKAARKAIEIEAKGMRFKTRVKASWARHFGLSPRVKPETVIARINEQITHLEKLGA